MKKEQLKEAVGELNLVDTVFEADGVSYIDTAVSAMQVYDLIELLDEPEKVVIPQFVAEYVDLAKSDVTLMRVLEIANRRSELPKWKKEYDWISANDETFARAWLYGYEVEEELLWEIPMPDLKTTGGHIQYLTYDPKARTYFASRKNGKLKQTFNAKDLVSVPGQYRRHAEMCDFKKIQEVAE